jgi:hypothetical protein
MQTRTCAIAALAYGGLACGKVEQVVVDASPADAERDAAPAYVCKPPMPSGVVPDDTSKPGWEISPGAAGSNNTGTAPGVFVVGDSLVFDLDVATMANEIRLFQGTSAVTVAASGASTAHFNKAGLIKPANLSTIKDYEALFGTVRITVLALGSNDARIITRERGQAGYTVDELAHQTDIAVTDALASSQCVLLINVANHWDAAAPDIVDQVNGVLRCAGTGNSRVRTFDWNSFSASHPEWFASPTDVHLSDAGQAAYRDFITNAVGAAIATGC